MKYLLVLVFAVVNLSVQANVPVDKSSNVADIASTPDKKVAVLLQTEQVWDGSDIAYPEGKGQYTVIRAELPLGHEVAMHCHITPAVAVVLKGSLKITTKAGESKILSAGDAGTELVNRWHSGVSTSKNTEVIVFYMAEVGTPLSINYGESPELTKACRD